MKDLEYGRGYKYAHNEADAIADMSCLPAALEGRSYYEPTDRGLEKELKARLERWRELKEKKRGSAGG
jgi:putative ATPase